MAKQNSELKLAISLSSEIDQFLYGTSKKAKKEFSQMTKAATQTALAIEMEFAGKEEKMQSLFTKLGNAGSKAFMATASAAVSAGKTIGKFGTMAAKEGLAFETAFDGVMKSTQASGAEYETMRNEILSMTREIPSASGEIAAIAAAAGQLGIPKDNIMEFSRTMLELSSATTMSANDAAAQLTMFGRIMNMSADEYDRLGSVLVSLGNEFSTAESQIAGMAVELAASGKLTGYSEAQIMAVAASMAGIGVEANVGGEAIGELTEKVSKAVEGGSKELKKYADVANMTADDFKEAFAKDKAGTMAKFISGLGEMEQSGKSSADLLKQMGFQDNTVKDTLIKLAGSGDLMSRALVTSNSAWNENIALTKEASDRYDTTQSKLSIMKNSFQEIGVELYNQFNGPLREGIFVITELAQAVATEIGDSNFLKNLSDSISSGAPTFVRNMKDMGEAIYRFSEPLIKVGAWLAGNTGLIEGTIAGIGTALATYKVANGVIGITKALSTLTTASAAGGAVSTATGLTALAASCWPILAIAGTAAVITGIAVAVKKASDEAVNFDLESHFGRVSLSMQELHAVAKAIVQGNDLAKLNEAIAVFDTMNNTESSIEDTVRSLNMANWKVQIGIVLSQEEQEAYKADLQSYISEVQNLVTQKQYSIGLSIGILTNDELEGGNLVTQINQFYSSKKEELSSLGKELNELLTGDLFELDDPTINKRIMEIQKKMAELTAKLTKGNFEAEMALVEGKYQGKELDSNSLMNLMAENRAEIERQKEGVDKAYTESYAANEIMYEDGAIKPEQYEENKRLFASERIIGIAGMQTRSLEFAGDAIYGSYDDELAKIEQIFSDNARNTIIDDELNSPLADNFDPNVIKNSIKDAVGRKTMKATSKLWDEIKETYNELYAKREELTNLGVAAPEEMNEAISRMSMIGAMAGDKDAILTYMGEYAGKDKEYGDKLQELNSREGFMMPEEIQSSLNNTVLISQDELRKKVEEMAAEGLDIQIEARYQVNPVVTASSKEQLGPTYPRQAAQEHSDQKKMKGFANGGIITRPEVALLAEAGYPEVVVPINGTQNAVSLWHQAGDMLGLFDKTIGISQYGSQLLNSRNGSVHSEESSQFTFSPIYQFHGEAPDRNDLDGHVKSSFAQWEGMMNRWMKNNKRFSFS